MSALGANAFKGSHAALLPDTIAVLQAKAAFIFSINWIQLSDNVSSECLSLYQQIIPR